MTAAAIFPMIGLIGGAVDIGRIYAVKTRLQAACDAGALAGRKTMGGGTWSASSGRANNAAVNIFDLNFKSGQFGTTGLTKTFTETNGTVTGNASATVPMTLMKLFGYTEITPTVTCNSMMRIPHSDVMFVLDVTGSMNCAPADTIATCSNNGGVEKSDAKMKGIRKATKCFYEALAKLDTGETCVTGEAAGQPNTGISSNIQLRFGFMPYSSNVNVGKLLPTAYFADNRLFQSRTPVTSTQWSYALGSWSAVTGSYGSWSNEPTPSSYNTASGYGGWATPATNPSSGRTVGGTTWARQDTTVTTSAGCTGLNNLSGSGGTLKAREDNAGTVATATGTPTNSPATYNGSGGPTQQVRTYSQTDPRTTRAARYVWANIDSTSNKCWLQVGTGSYSRVRSGPTDQRSITWTSLQRLDGWTLEPVTHNISGLKSGTNWNSSVSVANMSYRTQSYQMSGSSEGSMTNVNLVDNKTVSWAGCIEDAQTFQNTDGDPSDDWDPVPSAAVDLNVDLIPSASTPATLWGPALPGLVYTRSSGGSRTMADVYASGANSTSGQFSGMACPSEAAKLKAWTTTAFVDYLDDLIATGSTYHDIGLLWGARFISPTGIFASENATTTLSGSAGAQIQRHIVFMTDGDTGTCSSAYTPYGVAWWDRRQSNKDNPADDTGVSTCINSHTNAVTDARTAALCKMIKNDMNVTLWVVSYGSGVNEDTVNRLKSCASSTTKHYATATDTAALISKFQEIAAEIARLRLES